MSYSTLDIEQAFECAETTGNRIEIEGRRVWPPIGEVQARVFTHLEGNCTCDVNRCHECGCRPRNKMPRHTDDCSMKLGKA